jgi:hypothetical protein
MYAQTLNMTKLNAVKRRLQAGDVSLENRLLGMKGLLCCSKGEHTEVKCWKMKTKQQTGSATRERSRKSVESVGFCQHL